MILPDNVWQFVAKHSSESECHCKCGETFYSLAYYIGKKTGSVSRMCCPSCGSYQMDHVLCKDARTVHLALIKN